MQIVYMTDPHGSERHYRRCFEEAVSVGADLVVLGGDLCPDRDTPSWQAYWVEEHLYEWVTEFQRGGGCPIAGVIGNHDTNAALTMLSRMSGFTLLNGRVVPFGDYDLCGFHLTPPSPFPLKDTERRDLYQDAPPRLCPVGWVTGRGNEPERVLEAEYFAEMPSLEEELELLPSYDPRRTVMVMHSPPSGGVLDLLPRDILCGSKAIRNYLLDRQPLLALHGHIHESPWMTGCCAERLNRTLCINPGQEMTEPVIATFNLSDVEGTWRHTQALKLFG